MQSKVKHPLIQGIGEKGPLLFAVLMQTTSLVFAARFYDDESDYDGHNGSFFIDLLALLGFVCIWLSTSILLEGLLQKHKQDSSSWSNFILVSVLALWGMFYLYFRNVAYIVFMFAGLFIAYKMWTSD